MQNNVQQSSMGSWVSLPYLNIINIINYLHTPATVLPVRRLRTDYKSVGYELTTSQ